MTDPDAQIPVPDVNFDQPSQPAPVIAGSPVTIGSPISAGSPVTAGSSVTDGAPVVTGAPVIAGASVPTTTGEAQPEIKPVLKKKSSRNLKGSPADSKKVRFKSPVESP